MIETEERPPIDAYVVALDETSHYVIDEFHRPFIEKILGVYLFDHNEQTHCCEITPSFYLIHLYDTVVLTPAGEALSDAGKETLYNAYEHGESQDIYMHCYVMDGLTEKQPKSVRHHGDTGVGYDQSTHDEQIEGLREHFCGNCPF